MLFVFDQKAQTETSSSRMEFTLLLLQLESMSRSFSGFQTPKQQLSNTHHTPQETLTSEMGEESEHLSVGGGVARAAGTALGEAGCPPPGGSTLTTRSIETPGLRPGRSGRGQGLGEKLLGTLREFHWTRTLTKGHLTCQSAQNA